MSAGFDDESSSQILVALPTLRIAYDDVGQPQIAAVFGSEQAGVAVVVECRTLDHRVSTVLDLQPSTELVGIEPAFGVLDEDVGHRQLGAGSIDEYGEVTIAVEQRTVDHGLGPQFHLEAST